MPLQQWVLRNATADLATLLAAAFALRQRGAGVRTAALAIAALIGLANGVVVSLLHVHGFIATLGMGLIIGGYIATNYQGNHGSAPQSFRTVGISFIGPLPISTLIMLACAVGAIVMLRRTRLGHHLYAVGGNPEVARLSGVRTSVPVIAAHVLCSMLAGLAGLLLLAASPLLVTTLTGPSGFTCT